MSILFRESAVYRRKLMRLSAAMRRYHEFHLKNETGPQRVLSREIEDLEELSLSAYSLMKALKNSLVEAAKQKCSCIQEHCKKFGCNIWPLCQCHKNDSSIKPSYVATLGAQKPTIPNQEKTSCIIRPGGGSWPDGDAEDR